MTRNLLLTLFIALFCVSSCKKNSTTPANPNSNNGNNNKTAVDTMVGAYSGIVDYYYHSNYRRGADTIDSIHTSSYPATFEIIKLGADSFKVRPTIDFLRASSSNDSTYHYKHRSDNSYSTAITFTNGNQYFMMAFKSPDSIDATWRYGSVTYTLASEEVQYRFKGKK